MAKPTDHSTPQSPARPAQSEREARLSAALRENLRRRKAQSRARAAGEDAARLPSPSSPPARQD